MKKVACLGTEAFTLGFQLAGIRNAVTVRDGKAVLDEAHRLRASKEIGIVITDEEALGWLDGHEKAELLDSVEPVFIALSTQAGDTTSGSSSSSPSEWTFGKADRYGNR